jgi:hypothetical protein
LAAFVLVAHCSRLTVEVDWCSRQPMSIDGFVLQNA